MNKEAGYSQTPLSKKLGIKDGYVIKLLNQPKYYFELFTKLPANLTKEENSKIKKDFIHYFTTSLHELLHELPSLKKEIKHNGMIWISWPKKSSKITTDITEDDIRELALSNGLVDIKVCAIDHIWSGLKLVIPVKDRKSKI